MTPEEIERMKMYQYQEPIHLDGIRQPLPGTGTFPPGSSYEEQYQQQFDQQYQQQFNQEYERQYQEQYRQQYQNYQQSGGTIAPPPPQSSRPPTLREFLLGLLITLFPN